MRLNSALRENVGFLCRFFLLGRTSLEQAVVDSLDLFDKRACFRLHGCSRLLLQNCRMFLIVGPVLLPALDLFPHEAAHQRLFERHP